MGERIRDTLRRFCDMMLEKEPDTQSIKVKVEMKDKRNVKFKKFRGT